MKALEVLIGSQSKDILNDFDQKNNKGLQEKNDERSSGIKGLCKNASL